MKKLLVFILLVSISSPAFADHDEKFFNALKTCSPYVSNGALDLKNISADYNSKILGWQEDKCIYIERVNFSGLQGCLTCEFTQNQIDEISEIMQASKIIQNHTDEEIDISDNESLKHHPMTKMWNKYMNDPSICRIDINQ